MVIFKNDNGETYELWARGRDKYGTECGLLKTERGHWIAAWCLRDEWVSEGVYLGSWGQGHYFMKDGKGAVEFFADTYFMGGADSERARREFFWRFPELKEVCDEA